MDLKHQYNTLIKIHPYTFGLNMIVLITFMKHYQFIVLNMSQSYLHNSDCLRRQELMLIMIKRVRSDEVTFSL